MHEVPALDRTLLPFEISVPEPARIRKASCAFSAWYLHTGWPGWSTRRLIPNCANSPSPLPSQRVPRPNSAVSRQRASFVFSTNHPSPSGASPQRVDELRLVHALILAYGARWTRRTGALAIELELECEAARRPARELSGDERVDVQAKALDSLRERATSG